MPRLSPNGVPGTVPGILLMTDQKALLVSVCSVLLAGMVFLQSARISSAQGTDENSLYAVALGAYKDGFHDLAIDQFSQLLRLYPNSPKVPYAQFRIAESYFKQKNYEQSLTWYQKLLDQYPDKSDLLDKALYRLGQLYFFKKDYEKADSFYQKLLGQCPGSRLAGDALFWSAESNSQAGKWKEASQSYRQFLNNYPNHSHAADAAYGLGSAYLKLQDEGQALKAFQELTTRYPQNKQQVAKAWLNMADVEYRSGNYGKAAQNYQKVVHDYPDSPDIRLALYGAGLSFYQAQQFPKALEMYQQFLEKYPKDDLAETAAFQSGFMEFKLEKYSLAAGRLEAFIHSYGKSMYLPEAWYYLALSNQKLGKQDLAGQQLNRIVREFKSNPIADSAWLQLGAISYQSRQFPQAVRAYESASGSADRNVAAEALYWLGESWASQKNYDKAVQILLQIPRQYDGIAHWAVMAQMRAAGIYEHRGELNKALELYEKVAKSKSENQLRPTALQRIEKLRSQIKGSP
ncbi:MAG: tetratricopeptide repeat protein [bacterium]